MVPFILYCVYYYSRMIANAPYKFSEFKSFSIQYGTNDSLVNKYDSQTGDYQYLNDKDSLVKMNLPLSPAELDTLHKKAYVIGFFDFPGDERSYKESYKGKKPVRYIITFNYKRKSKKVIFDWNYFGEERLVNANKQFISEIKSVLADAEEHSKK
jgi:hypothetical protein